LGEGKYSRHSQEIHFFQSLKKKILARRAPESQWHLDVVEQTALSTSFALETNSPGILGFVS